MIFPYAGWVAVRSVLEYLANTGTVRPPFHRLGELHVFNNFFVLPTERAKCHLEKTEGLHKTNKTQAPTPAFGSGRRVGLYFVAKIRAPCGDY